MANIKKQAKVHQIYNWVLFRFILSLESVINDNILEIIGNANTTWIHAVMSGKKNTISICERIAFFASL